MTAGVRRLLATYRLQLHRDFTFAQAAAITPYLRGLGVSHAYTSPITRARSGSNHGYDVVDPTEVNPDLGGERGRVTFVRRLHREGLGLLLDIVPNHMGTGSENPFWEDVLTHGAGSRYARWFDIRWGSADELLAGRILLPVLGDKFTRALERGEITVEFSHRGIRVRYFDKEFPADPATIPMLLAPVSAGRGVPRLAARDRSSLETILTELQALPPRAPPEVASRNGAAAAPRSSAAEPPLRRLSVLWKRSPTVRRYVERRLAGLTMGTANRERLRAFLDAQPYRLAHWKRAARLINYRRFFDINELAAVRVEDPAVFAATHALILEWVRRGETDGLRIDHVDGLLDPLAYLVRLRDEITACISAGGKVGEPFPILVEKILTGDERLRNQWPVQGTTGYEFLNELESILVDPAGVSAIEDGYRALLTGAARSRTFRDVAHRGKGRILATSLRADVLRLAGLLAPLARRDANVAKFSQSRLAAALIEWVAGFPVYRTYVDGRGAIAVEDRELIDATAARVRREGASGRAVVPQALADFLRKTMLLTGEGGDRAEQLRAVLRMQQTSGPAAAKGVEDTALYVHVPLVSLNEVGGEPDRPLDDAVHALHEANAARAREWPLNLLCTNTHDTKRSADVRARLDALSEIPDTWLRAVSRWRRINREHRSMIGRRRMPDANTEYLLYQTMVGIWPSPGTGKGADAMPDRAAMASLRERVGEYMLKATREAKVSTSWTDPDEEFESALTTFIGALLHGRGTRSRFLADLATLVERIDVAGRWNAISRLVVHLTSPGTPDLYQGDELWNFALVDPDNRRPVDFARGRRLLASLERRWARGAGARQKLVRELAADPRDDRLKLFLTWRLLHARRERAALVRSGRYEPVRTMGAHATHLISFARTLGASASHADIALTVASRLTLAIGQPGSVPVGQMVWSDTRLQLRRAPGQSGPARWRCLLAGHTIESRADEGHIYLRAADVLAVLPVALLVPA